MNKYKFFLYSIMGLTYIPKSIIGINEKKLLHISDTPVMFYHELKRLIAKLSPHIIIHTGDLVDNIKIGVYENFLPKYEYHVKKVINIIEDSPASVVYICIGNHDNLDVIKKYSRRSIIIKELEQIEIFGTTASLSHYPLKIIENPSVYNFFGHDKTIGNDVVKGKTYLNGINSINILTEKTKRLFYLPYPFGTDDSRLMKGKIGL